MADDELRELSLLLRATAREHLGLRDGDHWPSDVADAQARAVLAARDADLVCVCGHGVVCGECRVADQRELERLRAWKAEVLPVLSGLQLLGRVLGVRLGESITGEAGLARARALADLEAAVMQDRQ